MRRGEEIKEESERRRKEGGGEGEGGEEGGVHRKRQEVGVGKEKGEEWEQGGGKVCTSVGSTCSVRCCSCTGT